MNEIAVEEEDKNDHQGFAVVGTKEDIVDQLEEPHSRTLPEEHGRNCLKMWDQVFHMFRYNTGWVSQDSQGHYLRSSESWGDENHRTWVAVTP